MSKTDYAIGIFNGVLGVGNITMFTLNGSEINLFIGGLGLLLALPFFVVWVIARDNTE